MRSGGSGITVIIPTFNDGAWLLRCLESVASQTLIPDEVILVDDGSTDMDSLAAIDAAAARFPTIHLIRQPNRGASAARNRGLADATGRWVAFVDADDEMLPDSLRLRHALVASNPAAVAAYCGIIFAEPSGHRLPSRYRTGAALLDVDAIGARTGVPGYVWAYLIDRSAIVESGGFNETLPIMEDFDLLARIGRGGGIFLGSETPGYIQHRRPGSLARGSARRQMLGALRFLAEARRQRYFSRANLVRRYLRVPVAAAKVVLRYRLGRSQRS